MPICLLPAYRHGAVPVVGYLYYSGAVDGLFFILGAILPFFKGLNIQS
jgi:hypothetical protein